MLNRANGYTQFQASALLAVVVTFSYNVFGCVYVCVGVQRHTWQGLKLSDKVNSINM